MTTTENIEAVHYLSNGASTSPCGVNIQTTPYTYGSPDWADVDCAECLKHRPVGHVVSATVTPIPGNADRTVQNMIAAAEHIEKSVEALIGGQANVPAGEILKHLRTITATYRTLLPQ